jgi:hypothetical protein
MLKRHRKTQVTERLRAGDQWTDTGLVFANESGLFPTTLLNWHSCAAKNAPTRP